MLIARKLCQLTTAGSSASRARIGRYCLPECEREDARRLHRLLPSGPGDERSQGTFAHHNIRERHSGAYFRSALLKGLSAHGTNKIQSRKATVPDLAAADPKPLAG